MEAVRNAEAILIYDMDTEDMSRLSKNQLIEAVCVLRNAVSDAGLLKQVQMAIAKSGDSK